MLAGVCAYACFGSGRMPLSMAPMHTAAVEILIDTKIEMMKKSDNAKIEMHIKKKESERPRRKWNRRRENKY